LLGLVAIEKSRVRQKSRITWLKKWAASTEFFHIMANVKRRKIYIHSLQTNEGLVVSQTQKHAAIFNHFKLHIGTYFPRDCSLNFLELGWEPRHLSHLDLPFTEDEVKKVIMKAPKEKAPGPNGCIFIFFSSCWEILREDLCIVVHHFYHMNQQELNYLNHAFVVLVPKKHDPQFVYDFRPINLSRSFAKIISKLMANRLGLELSELISINQTAFIRKRCIHDNFMYVQHAVKYLHRRKIPSLFMKLDISKAFDLVNWPYLMSIMTFLGFGHRCDWISSL
jgi:hypothetical protein